MNSFKKVLTVLTITITLILSTLVNTYAVTFNDVSKEHWAYNYIQNMSDLGILVGDLSGNFNPDANISKFDALKIIATLAGYEYNNKSDIHKNYYKTLNEKYKDVISFYENKYSKWNFSVSYEIAYLLEKGILKLNELDQLIVLQNGKEQLRALSNEEIALYLVRIMGLEEEVNKMEFDYTLEDSINIAPDKINSVYYLKSLNIFNLSSPKFYPKKAITKAKLSELITNFLNYTGIKINVNNNEEQFSGNNIYTKFVLIEKIYFLENIIQIKTEYGTKFYKLKDNLNVVIDGEKALLNDISEKTYAEVTFNDSLISDIIINTNIKNYPNYEVDLKEISQYKTINGIIKNINKDSIAISYKPTNTDGFLDKERIEIIPLAKDCKVIKGVNFLSIENLSLGQLVTINLYNNTATEIYLEEPNSIYIGEFIERDNSNKYIIIKTPDNKVLKLELDEDKIENIDSLLKSLSIGDILTITTTNSKVSKISVASEKIKKQGIIKSIKIYDGYAIINIQNEDFIDDFNNYYVDTNKIDIYSIRVLDTVFLEINSKEIYSLDLIKRDTKS